MGALGAGAVIIAAYFGVVPSLELAADDQVVVRSLSVFAVVVALCGTMMAAWPGARPVPWDFEDWLEELNWSQRGGYLTAVIAGVGAGLWLFEPWAPLAAMVP